MSNSSILTSASQVRQPHKVYSFISNKKSHALLTLILSKLNYKVLLDLGKISRKFKRVADRAGALKLLNQLVYSDNKILTEVMAAGSTTCNLHVVNSALCIKDISGLNDIQTALCKIADEYVSSRNFENRAYFSILLMFASDEARANLDECGDTILHEALDRGYDDIAVSIIHKMDRETLMITGKYGRTALHHAVWHGYTNVVDALLARQVRLDLKDKYGDTVLHDALRRGHDDIGIKLIHMMDDDTLNWLGALNRLPLYYAITRGCSRSIDALRARQIES